MGFVQVTVLEQEQSELFEILSFYSVLLSLTGYLI